MASRREEKANADQPVVYDKAKWHYGGDYPEELPDDQAFVHTGMFLGWIIDNDLHSEYFDDDDEAITAFKARRMTGREIYRRCDGCLVDDMLSAEGNAFAADYFDFKRGEYLADYQEILGEGLPSLYHVEDTWENYELLKARVDARYAAWREERR